MFLQMIDPRLQNQQHRWLLTAAATLYSPSFSEYVTLPVAYCCGDTLLAVVFEICNIVGCLLLRRHFTRRCLPNLEHRCLRYRGRIRCNRYPSLTPIKPL
jgi:hypothetical protein